MKIVVLLAGVIDPKWPIGPIGGSAGAGESAVGAGLPRVLSPFDASALELALKLRDKNPACTISAAMVGGEGAGPLLTQVASHRLDEVVELDPSALNRWDLRAFGLALAAHLNERHGDAELVLMGREFGDTDDGTLPPYLAASLNRPFCGLCQDVVVRNGRPGLYREHGSEARMLLLDRPLVASVTNARTNRLRHPLMKNVMSAKRQKFEVHALEPVAGTASVTVRNAGPAEERKRSGECEFLCGTPEQMAAALLERLRDWKVTW